MNPVQALQQQVESIVGESRLARNAELGDYRKGRKKRKKGALTRLARNANLGDHRKKRPKRLDNDKYIIK